MSDPVLTEIRVRYPKTEDATEDHNLRQINRAIQDIEEMVALGGNFDRETPEIKSVHGKITTRSNELYSFIFACAEHEVKLKESDILGLLQRAVNLRREINHQISAGYDRWDPVLEVPTHLDYTISLLIKLLNPGIYPNLKKDVESVEAIKTLMAMDIPFATMCTPLTDNASDINDAIIQRTSVVEPRSSP